MLVADEVKEAVHTVKQETDTLASDIIAKKESNRIFAHLLEKSALIHKYIENVFTTSGMKLRDSISPTLHDLHAKYRRAFNMLHRIQHKEKDTDSLFTLRKLVVAHKVQAVRLIEEIEIGDDLDFYQQKEGSASIAQFGGRQQKQ